VRPNSARAIATPLLSCKLRWSNPAHPSVINTGAQHRRLHGKLPANDAFHHNTDRLLTAKQAIVYIRLMKNIAILLTEDHHAIGEMKKSTRAQRFALEYKY